MCGKELSWVDICPESLVFSKRNLCAINLCFTALIPNSVTHLQFYRICIITLSCEHSHCMMKDVATTLNPLIEPAGSMLVFVDGYGECLSSTIVDGFDKSDIELFGVLS